MRMKFAGNKADVELAVVKNAEASTTIPRGTPVILNFNGTDDGLAVVLPATAGSAKSFGFCYGVVTDNVPVGGYNDAIVSGYCAYALITRMTRAATTDSWTSSNSQASGICLGIDTLNNAFLLGASSAGSLQAGMPKAVLVDSLASSTSSASATSDTRTAITNGVRVYVKML